MCRDYISWFFFLTLVNELPTVSLYFFKVTTNGSNHLYLSTLRTEKYHSTCHYATGICYVNKQWLSLYFESTGDSPVKKTTSSPLPTPPAGTHWLIWANTEKQLQCSVIRTKMVKIQDAMENTRRISHAILKKGLSLKIIEEVPRWNLK